MEVDMSQPIQHENIHIRDGNFLVFMKMFALLRQYLALEACATARRKKSIAMPRPVAEIIGYMIRTHGDPTEPSVLANKSMEKSILLCMTRDKRNLDQLTPKQLKRKIIAFKRVPEFVDEYLTKMK